MENFSVLVIEDYRLIMDDSVNMPSLIVNDVKVAESKLTRCNFHLYIILENLKLL